MDTYKKIFRTPRSRDIVLSILSFLPDSVMLKIQYYIKLKRKLNLKNPRRFTEKIQQYKINYRVDLLHKCVDKFLVRDFIKEKGLGNILVPLIGHFKSIDEIVWANLPDSFVVKSTDGGGGLNVFICSNKADSSREEMIELFSKNQRSNKINSGGREWAYYGLKPGIVVEELLVNKDEPFKGLNDYKFFCFNGKPKYVVVDTDRYTSHKRNFYDIKWNKLDVESDCASTEKNIEKPINLETMLEICSILSEDFPFVRVDLYNISGKIYFGELTFYPWSGYVQFNPDNFDFILGENFKLPNIIVE